jgi:membrane protein involved in colicin uptake
MNNKTKFYFMSVNNKHLATFLLGAAAAFGAYKYVNLSDEEKEKMAASLKDRANKLKDQAVAAEDKALDYFNELKTKGSDAFNEHMPKMEEFFNNFFGGSKAATAGATAGATGTQGSGATAGASTSEQYSGTNNAGNTGNAGI